MDITPIKESIRIFLASNEFVRQEMINWCGIHTKEYGARRFLQQQDIASYFS